MKFCMFDVREKGGIGMIAHGQDDVDVGRNLTVTGEYVEVSTWISLKKFVREDVH